MADLETCVTCANPECTEPGTKKCGACGIPYCGPICQTANWPLHKESCPGHLRKMGMAHLEKAEGFGRERNCPETLRYAELALTKLNQLKDRSLAVIEILDQALLLKFNALNFMGRNTEALECATERYNMWATTFMRNPRTINAAFPLIQSLIFNKEYSQAHLIASTVHEMTMHPTTHDIPENKQQLYLAQAGHLLAEATLHLSQAGGIPPEEKQKAGEEAIAHARKALEIHTLLCGANDHQVAHDRSALAASLFYFNEVDAGDEVIRLFEQAMVIQHRFEGSLSVNVAVNNENLGSVYSRRARRAVAANDLDRELVNLKLALSHSREAVRVFRAINHVDKAEDAAQKIIHLEKRIRNIRPTVAVAASATRG